MRSETFKNNFFTVFQLAKRNLKVFLKDKASVFFSLLAPLIILMLYIFFLGNIQVDSVLGAIPDGVHVSEKAVKAFVDSWLIAGVVGVSCLTVALNSALVMVSDKQSKIVDDYTVSPAKPYLISVGYFIAFFVVTVLIGLMIYAVGLAYLALCGSLFMSFQEVLLGILALILSSLSSVAIMVFIVGFFKTVNSVSAFSGIFSAIVGFLIGAYMPINAFPKAIQYMTAFIPGTHSTGIFRNLFMQGSLEQLSQGLPIEVTDTLAKAFSMEIDFFGNDVGIAGMYIVLVASIFVFLGINLLVKKKK